MRSNNIKANPNTLIFILNKSNIFNEVNKSRIEIFVGEINFNREFGWGCYPPLMGPGQSRNEDEIAKLLEALRI